MSQLLDKKRNSDLFLTILRRNSNSCSKLIYGFTINIVVSRILFFKDFIVLITPTVPVIVT